MSDDRSWSKISQRKDFAYTVNPLYSSVHKRLIKQTQYKVSVSFETTLIHFCCREGWVAAGVRTWAVLISDLANWYEPGALNLCTKAFSPCN